MLVAGTFFGFGWSAPEEAHAVAGDTVTASTLQVGDIIYYGNYPQTKVTAPAGAPASPENGDTYTDASSVKYEYVDSVTDTKDGWYKYEPIAWRVLENAAGKLFLLAYNDMNPMKYNLINMSMTWEKCTSRSWLNGYDASENTVGEDYSAAGNNFIGNAFSAAEQAKIVNETIENPANPAYTSIPTGPSTTDKIFYLTLDDVHNASYGFTNSNSRIGRLTDYAKKNGNEASWLLRSPGFAADRVAYVTGSGDRQTGGITNSYTMSSMPAFYLSNLESLVLKETASNVYTPYQTSLTTAPTVKTGLTYTGSAQALVNAGSGATGGTLQYKLDSENYSATIPTATNAGDYTVKYKVVGDAGHSDSAEGTLDTITIAKANNSTLSVTQDDITYGVAEVNPEVAGANGEVTFEYKLKNADDETYTTDKPTNAGDYTVQASDAGTANYNAKTDTDDFTINKATVSAKAIAGVTAPASSATPVSAITGTAQYTGTVSWSPAVSETFDYETTYTATITLTPKSNYTLEGVEENYFTVAGADATNDEDDGVITAIFPATDTDKDTDGDGVPDNVEEGDGTDSEDEYEFKDTDEDGVPDYVEDKDGTDPEDKDEFKDTDEDGVPDYVEERDGTNPNDKDSFKDTDEDGVPDYVEERDGADPNDQFDFKDTDKDGVPDYVENKDGTNPEGKDSFKDTDEDGVPDYVEERDGTYSNDKDSFKDTDEDGVPDYVEERDGTDPTDQFDFKDTDGDGVPDYVENKDGTDPENPKDFNPGSVVKPHTNANLKTFTIIANMLGFTLKAAPTIIKYSITVPYITESFMLTAEQEDPTATVEGEGMKQLAVGPNEFTLTVRAQDGTTTKIYTIIIIRESPLANANLTELSVSPGTLAPAFDSGREETEYAANVPYTTKEITINAEAYDGNSTVAGDGKHSLSAGENAFPVTVTAEDGVTSKTYIVIVTRALPKTDATLADLTAGGTSLDGFDAGKFAYEMSVPYATNSITLAAETSDENATVYGDGDKQLSVGSNVFQVMVTAEDGITTKIYTVTVTRGLPNTNLKSLSVSTGELTPEFSSSTQGYAVVVPHDTESITLTAEAESGGADVSGDGEKSGLNTGMNVFEITVTAEDGSSSRKYTVIVIREAKEKNPNASKDASLATLTVSEGELAPEFDPEETEYAVSVPYDINQVTLDAEKSDGNAAIYGDGEKQLSVGENAFPIMVVAEDETTIKTYTVTVTRETLNTDLKELSVSAGELTPEFDPKVTGYTVNVSYATENITLSAEAESGEVTGAGEKALDEVDKYVFEITVTAEDEITEEMFSKTYTVVVIREAPNANLKELSVSADGLTPNLSPDFNPYIAGYNVHVPYATENITLTAKAYYDTVQVIYDDTKPLVDGSNVFFISVIAEDGITNKMYAVSVNRDAVNTDANLKSLSVKSGGTELLTGANAFSADKTGYKLSVPNGTSSVTLAAEADGKATLAENSLGEKKLSVIGGAGNVFTIPVTAESGAVKNYVVTVTRAAPVPKVYPKVTSIKTPMTKMSIVVKKGKLNLKNLVGLYTTGNKPIKDPKLTWTSSKKKVATVSKKGVVKAGKKTGKTVITVKAQNGKSLKITITVVKKAKKLKKLSGKVPKLKKGKPAFITLKGTGTNITKIKWKVKGKGLKIDKFGMATATKKGKFTITATAGGKKWTKKVTVK